MAIPIVFIPNEQARANDLNANFAYILSIIGELSTPGRVHTTTEFLMGFRQNTLQTGTHDTGVDPNYNFFQIGYNADWNYSSTWKFTRFINNLGASAIRLGEGSFEVMTTSATTGSLDAQLRTVFKIKATTGTPNSDYIYIPKGWSMQIVDGIAGGIEDYRLTRVFLDTPKAIYENQALNTGIDVIEASIYDIPTFAKAIEITTDVISTSGALKFYQDRAVRHWKYGFVSRSGGSGVVQLGEGSHAGKFVIERSGPISSASAYITSYFI